MAKRKPWSGWRLLVVGDVRYRWQCAFHYPIEVLSMSYVQRGRTWTPDTLVVRPEDRSSARLRVQWPACCGPLLMPRHVRWCIDEARRQGWLTEEPQWELHAPTLPYPEANVPNHDVVDVVVDLLNGQPPRHPHVHVRALP